MKFSLSDLWDWRGTVGRGRYVLSGLILFAAEHNLDRYESMRRNTRNRRKGTF